MDQVDVLDVRVDALEDLLEGGSGPCVERRARGDAGGDELDRQRALARRGIVDRRVGRRGCDVHGPARVDVARQHDHSVDGLERLEETLPREDVSVPLVGVDRVECLRGAAELTQHHLLSEDLPDRRRRLQTRSQPGLLLRSQDLSRWIAPVAGSDLLVAAVDARVEHEEIEQAAVGERAPDLADLPLADGHVLGIHLVGDGLSLGIGAFGRRIVVARAIPPGIVGRLVVVPHADEGVLLVRGLKIGVEAVVLVAAPVVFEREDLVRRIHRAVLAILAVPILVDVIAQVQHEIEVRLFGDMAIHVEIAVRVVRAAHHAEAEAVDGPGRRRACAARQR